MTAVGNQGSPMWLSRLLVVLIVIALCVPAEAQQAGKLARIGYLDNGSAPGSAELLDVFRKQMTQFSWIEGNNLAIEYRYADGDLDRLSKLATELVALKVDVIVANTTASTLAIKKVTSTIPIVMVNSTNPVENGLIASLARPGGNVTGNTAFAEELAGKRLQILKEVSPKSTRIGVLTGGPGGQGTSPEIQVKAIKETAFALGLKTVEIGSVIDHEKLLNAFQLAVRERVNGIITISGPIVFAQRKSVILLAANYKLPAIYPQKEFVEEGGFMSYGSDLRENYRHAAIYLNKILRGAKPADLPVERPTKFEFAINLKTAKQIGLTIPPNVLARADKVIR